MTAFKNDKVKEKFDNYPSDVRYKILELRELIFDVAKNEKIINNIDEMLKWNEPSYITKNGSTLRIDWKKNKPNQYSMYFNCKTKLVETFRELFSDRFQFEGNREIIFQKDDIIDLDALKNANIVPRSAESIKVIATGEVNKALTIQGLLITVKAKEAIENAGGKVID